MLEMTPDALLHLLDRERTIPYEGYPVTICRSRYGAVHAVPDAMRILLRIVDSPEPGEESSIEVLGRDGRRNRESSDFKYASAANGVWLEGDDRDDGK